MTQGFLSGGHPPPNDVLFPHSNSRVASWTGRAPCMIAPHQHLTLWNCTLKPSIKLKFYFEFEPGENSKTATTNVNSALSKTSPLLWYTAF
jgi:hypothetical protein